MRFEIVNGIRVFFEMTGDTPLFYIAVLVEAGSIRDPFNKAGLSCVAATSIQRSSLNNRSLNKKISQLGVKILLHPSKDYVMFSMVGYPNHASILCELMIDLICNHIFTEEEIDEIVEDLVNEHKMMLANLQIFAFREFAKRAFNKHPYAWPFEGCIRTLQRIKLSDVVNFYRLNYTAGLTRVLIISPPLRGTEQNRILTIFSKWKNVPHDRHSRLNHKSYRSRNGLKVYYTGQKGAYTIEGLVIPHLSEKEFLSLLLLEKYLYQKTSQKIAFDRALIYSSSGFFRLQREGSILALHCAAAKSDIDMISHYFFTEILKLQLQLPSYTQFRCIKAQLQNLMMASMQNKIHWLETIGNYDVYGFDVEFYNARVKMLEEISLAELETTAKKYILESKIVRIVVK